MKGTQPAFPILCLAVILFILLFSSCAHVGTAPVTEQLFSAEPQYTDVWPENDLTACVPEPQDCTVRCLWDFSDSGKYGISMDFSSTSALEAYVAVLKAQGYTETAVAEGQLSRGLLLEKDSVFLSVASSGRTINLLISIAEAE